MTPNTQEAWEAPSEPDIAGAKTLAKLALADDSLWKYYDLGRDYAGVSFATLAPVVPYDITTSDLHAVSLLGVTIGPRATRRLLEPGDHRTAVLAALCDLGPDQPLERADSELLQKCWALHEAVLSAVKDDSAADSRPWVSTAKLTARKRPSLIPVRDNVVGKALGKRAWESGKVYWQIMQRLLQDTTVRDLLGNARERVLNASGDARGAIEVDQSDLRLLDAAIWKHLSDRARNAREEAKLTALEGSQE